VQVTDNGTPVATANANLSIMITPPPVRNAALYIKDTTVLTGLQIHSDGSLMLLPPSPESGLAGYAFAASPTLPLIFLLSESNNVEALLVNPDHSLTLDNSSATLPSTNCYSPPSVDPTGSNLYVPGFIDSNNDFGVFIYPANGLLQSLGSIAILVVAESSRMVFAPDGTLAFLGTCPGTGQASTLSYSRASNGTLTSAATYPLTAVFCIQGLAVSPDGKYLAEWEGDSGVLQFLSIASNGILSPATQPFTVTFDAQGTLVEVLDMAWNESGSFLFAGTAYVTSNPYGGVAVLRACFINSTSA